MKIPKKLDFSKKRKRRELVTPKKCALYCGKRDQNVALFLACCLAGTGKTNCMIPQCGGPKVVRSSIVSVMIFDGS